MSAAPVPSDEPLRKFVIFGIGRCGSSMLVDMLNSQPRVCCDFFIAEKTCDPYTAMRSRAAQVESLGAAAFGVRLLVPHLASEACQPDIPGLIAQARADGWTVIHTRRSSLLRTAISYVYTDQHGFHLRDQDGPWQFKPTSIDMADFSDWLTLVMEWAEIERRTLADFENFDIVYEDDLATEATQRKTLTLLMDHLLGVQAVPVRTAFRRQLPANDLPELVLNFPDVIRFLEEKGLTKLRETYSSNLGA